MRNLFTNPPRLPLVAASILSADFAKMGEECRQVLTPAGVGDLIGGAGADLLHVDVMDAHFVPNLAIGPDTVKAIHRYLPQAFLDVHLMVTNPWPLAEVFVRAGASHITFHAEVLPESEIAPTAARIRELGVTVGLAINPPTPLERIMPHLELFDLILVMSVSPGFSGQGFIPAVLEKTRAISEELTPNQRLEMDGGVKPLNVESVLNAGCDVVVAASAIFGAPTSERSEVVAALRGSRTPRIPRG